MSQPALTEAVERLAWTTQGWSDAALDRAWAWREYDEGLRVAFFRTYEELRELATRLAAERESLGPPATTAQRVLAQYHLAYRDLRAALLGVGDEELDHEPAAGEWPLRQVLRHMMRADLGFFAAVSRALHQHRAGAAPARATDEEQETFMRTEVAPLEAAGAGPLTGIIAYHEVIHDRILREFAGIGEDELNTPSWFWESEPMSVRFRLHRFDAHLRQHTIQADKTLALIGHGPTEAQRLLRLIGAALAEAEGAVIGAPQVGARLSSETAATIAARTDELAAM